MFHIKASELSLRTIQAIQIQLFLQFDICIQFLGDVKFICSNRSIRSI